MREIDNNINNVNFKNIPQPSLPETKNEALPAPGEKKEINDLKNMPAASLGQSQIASDSIESDLKFLEKHPMLTMAMNEAIEEYSKTHTEEETIKMIEAVHQEFVSKR